MDMRPNVHSTPTPPSHLAYSRDKGRVRDWFAKVVSGVEHFWVALQVDHGSKTRAVLVTLGIRCLVLQTVLNGVALLLALVDQGTRTRKESYNVCASTFRQLVFPGVLLYRYLRPQLWDDLFMATVRRLGCEQRSDMVAKPRPGTWAQLKGYLKRLGQTFGWIWILNWLAFRTGWWTTPRMGLAIWTVHEYLLQKGIPGPLMKLAWVWAIMDPHGFVWTGQTVLIQQAFVQELVQPYLGRVQFKSWEERAWWAEHQAELLGFGLGAWLVCGIPWVGVAFLPVLFTAVACLLGRSCGLMENAGHGLSGDIMERQSPGVKAVARGESPSVTGDWDSTRVGTRVRRSRPYVKTEFDEYTGKMHHITGTMYYGVDVGVREAVKPEEVQRAMERSMALKAGLYQEMQAAAAALANSGQDHGQESNEQIHQSAPSSQPLRATPVLTTSTQSTPLKEKSSPFETTRHEPLTETGLVSPIARSSSPPHQRHPSAPAPNPLPSSPPTRHDSTLSDLTRYNFSDRKTDVSIPSAPPALDAMTEGQRGGPQFRGYDQAQDVYRVESVSSQAKNCDHENGSDGIHRAVPIGPGFSMDSTPKGPGSANYFPGPSFPQSPPPPAPFSSASTASTSPTSPTSPSSSSQAHSTPRTTTTTRAGTTSTSTPRRAPMQPGLSLAIANNMMTIENDIDRHIANWSQQWKNGLLDSSPLTHRHNPSDSPSSFPSRLGEGGEGKEGKKQKKRKDFFQ